MPAKQPERRDNKPAHQIKNKKISINVQNTNPHGDSNHSSSLQKETQEQLNDQQTRPRKTSIKQMKTSPLVNENTSEQKSKKTSIKIKEQTKNKKSSIKKQTMTKISHEGSEEKIQRTNSNENISYEHMGGLINDDITTTDKVGLANPELITSNEKGLTNPELITSNKEGLPHNQMRQQRNDGRLFFLDKPTGKERIETNRILQTLRNISYDLDIPDQFILDLHEKICDGLCDNMSVDQFYSLITECAASCMTKHPEFDVISRRLAVKQNHSKTNSSFYKKVKYFYNLGLYFDKSFYERVKESRKEIEEMINYKKDYNLSYFGLRTLERSYLLKHNEQIIERPQDMYMRVSLGIHYDSLEDAFETYKLLSSQYFSHATPTMFNAGTFNQQMASCFLLGIENDTTESIFDTVKNAALISKRSGGLGIHVHNLRGVNSLIKSSGGRTSGIVPVLKIFNSTLRCIDQGGKKRPGSCAIYLEPWHCDVLEFLDLRKNTGKEEMRARDLFIALWIPDLFMTRVQNDEEWSLFSPDDVPGLNLLYGDNFKQKYLEAERNKKARKVLKAQTVWKAIISSQIETGLPYMLYKDTINKHNNQKHLGTIQTSNLCAEIVQYTSQEEIAMCNLASIGLPSFLVKKGQSPGQWHHRRIYLPDRPVAHKDTLLNNKAIGKEISTATGSSSSTSNNTGTESSEEMNLKGEIIKNVEKLKSNETEKYNDKIDKNNDETDKNNDNEIDKHNDNKTDRNNDNKIDKHNDNKIDKNNHPCNTNSSCPSKTDESHLSSDPEDKENIPPCKKRRAYSQNQAEHCHMSSVSNIDTNTTSGTLSYHNKNCSDIQTDLDIQENGFLDQYKNVITGPLEFTTDESEYFFDFSFLRYVVGVLVRNMNKIIDINLYPLEEARTSNFKHRPLGLGIQGLADLFVLLKLPFESDKARELNKLIFETIQYAALEASCRLAKANGPYPSFEGSPASKGILHFDFYGVKPITPFDWMKLRKNIAKYGLRNSLLTALMPTASTSQIMGYNECFEPFTSNIYTRRTLAGDFQVINKYLLRDLIKLNLWNDEMKNILIEQQGSIQKINSIPNNLKQLYKTVWELSMKSLINLSSDRQPFIDQTQSLNMFIAAPTYQKITSMHFYSWKKKLKTGMYYLRTKPIASAVQFTVDRDAIRRSNLITSDLQFSAMNSEDNTDCEACSA